MADGNSQLELEIALRDAASSVLKDIGRNVDSLNRKLIEAGALGSGSLESIRRRFHLLDDQGKKTGGSVAELDKVFGGMVKTLLAPVGLVAGFVALGKSLETFSVQQLQLSGFASNIGLAVRDVNRFRQQAELVGISNEKSMQQLGTMGQILKEMFVNRANDPRWKKLHEGNATLARTVDHLLQQQKVMEAIGAIQESYFRGGPRWRALLEETFGREKSLWDATKNNLEGLPKLYEAPTDAVKKYNERYSELLTILRNIKSISFTAIILELEMLLRIPSLVGGAMNKSLFGKGGEYLLEGEGGAEKPSLLNRFKGWFRLGSAEAAEGNETLELSAKARRDNELDVEEDTNKSLHDIRDILMKFELGEAGGGPSGGMLFRPGIFGGGGTRRGWGGGQGQASRDFPVDQSGKPIDMETVAGLRDLAVRGDTRGMQAFMAQRGYRVDSAWCGDLAKAFVQGSGYAPPKGYPIASNWRTWGQSIDPSGINAENRPFGSIVASKTNVPIGSTGGHVMTIVPGTYDPKTNTAVVADTHGQVRRSLSGFEVRYAGDEAVKLAQERQRGIGLPPVGTLPPGGVAKALTEPDAPPLAGVRKIGVTQNNPHNLKYTGSPWQVENLPGLRPGTTFDQGDRQAAFNSPQAGWNAAAVLALRKASQGMRTVRQMIASQQGWTPGNQGAATNVAGMMGVKPDEILNFNDPNVLSSYLRALEVQEQGKHYYPPEMADIAARKAIAAYSGQTNDQASARETVDKSLVRRTGGEAKNGTVSADIDFSELANPRASSLDTGVFKVLNLGRTAQAGQAGGGVQTFNRFAFE